MERLDDRLNVVQRIAQLGFWEMRAQDWHLTLSDEACAICGIETGNRELSFNAFLLFVLQADRERVRAAFDRTMQGGVPLDIEHRIVQPSGAMRRVHARAELLLGNDGLTVCFGTVHDMTELVRRQEEAEQNNLLLQIAGRIAHVGGWRYESATGRLVWSDEVCKIHEVPTGTCPTTDEAFIYYAPEWRQIIRNRFDACLRDGVPYDEELQIVTATGRRVWVRAIGEPVRNTDNAIAWVQGAVQDITEKKEAEAKAEDLLQRLTATLESITDAFYTLDQEWRFTYLNKEAERLLQKPRNELLGKVLWEEYSALKGQIGYVEFHRAVREKHTVVFEEFYAPYQTLSEVRAYPSERGLTVYFRDITQARKTQESLRISEERFRIIAQSTTDVTWDWDLHKNKLWCSDNVQNLFGYTPHDFDGPRELWAQRIHPDDRARVLEHLGAAINGRHDHWIDEYRFIRKNGSIAEVLDRGFILRDSEGKATRMAGALADLTERREADARIREQASLLDKAKDAIVVRGIDNLVRYWNKGAERLYGWTAEEAVGRSVEELLYADPAPLHEAMRQVLESGEWSGEITERRKDGSALPVEVQWTLMRDEAGRPESIFAIKTDISRRKEAERRIEHLAFYDPLTQLPNRQLLMDRLQQAIASSSRSGCANALIFIDLDNFKSLNDTLGHTIGDMLLQEAAQRMVHCVSNHDTVARFGGDEYVVLLQSLGSDIAEAIPRARAIGERILKALNQSYQLGDYRHSVSASIGVTLFDSDKDDVGELLKRADLAMYQAKAAGRNTLRYFDPTLEAALSARMKMEEDLRRGLREHHFLLYYQPQVDQSGRVTGVEALVRWQHPARGLLAPVEFIPLAEETGLVLPLGQWVLETACRQLSAWAAHPQTAHLEIAVNVSARQFHAPGFVTQVLDILGPPGAGRQQLKLELTETALLENVEDTIAKMQILRQRGLSFALDDFGTGYSSLAYLKRLPLDMLKIDRSFVVDLLTNPNDAVIARTIIALGRNLGLKVVAEGVETEAQRDFLFLHGCAAYQGYLCTMPLPADAIAAMMDGVGMGLA
jgi:diguanylate cyclase (GGDEF)-like protein/PAS domain S-box-containing protein